MRTRAGECLARVGSDLWSGDGIFDKRPATGRRCLSCVEHGHFKNQCSKPYLHPNTSCLSGAADDPFVFEVKPLREGSRNSRFSGGRKLNFSTLTEHRKVFGARMPIRCPMHSADIVGTAQYRS